MMSKSSSLFSHYVISLLDMYLLFLYTISTNAPLSDPTTLLHIVLQYDSKAASYAYSWRSLQMERELVANSFILETKRDFDQVQQNHFKSFKKLVDSQNLKGVSEPKVEVISTKIDRLAAIYISKFKWAWWIQFFSHTLQILEINLSSEAVQMILLYL